MGSLRKMRRQQEKNVQPGALKPRMSDTEKWKESFQRAKQRIPKEILSKWNDLPFYQQFVYLRLTKVPEELFEPVKVSTETENHLLKYVLSQELDQSVSLASGKQVFFESENEMKSFVENFKTDVIPTLNEEGRRKISSGMRLFFECYNEILDTDKKISDIINKTLPKNLERLIINIRNIGNKIDERIIDLSADMDYQGFKGVFSNLQGEFREDTKYSLVIFHNHTSLNYHYMLMDFLNIKTSRASALNSFSDDFARLYLSFGDTFAAGMKILSKERNEAELLKDWGNRSKMWPEFIDMDKQLYESILVDQMGIDLPK